MRWWNRDCFKHLRKYNNWIDLVNEDRDRAGAGKEGGELDYDGGDDEEIEVPKQKPVKTKSPEEEKFGDIPHEDEIESKFIF